MEAEEGTTHAFSIEAEVDVADLLKIDVSYGRLQLMLRGVLDTLRKNAKETSDLRSTCAELKDEQKRMNDELAAQRDALAELDKLRAELDALRGLADRVSKLEQRPIPEGAAPIVVPATPAAPVVPEYDDSILDDVMASHERRLRNLEDEVRGQSAKLTGAPPSATTAAGPKIADPSGAAAVKHMMLNPPASIDKGQTTGPMFMLMNTPAVGGDLILAPSDPVLKFSPEKIHVREGSIQSEPFSITATALRPAGTPPHQPFMVTISAGAGNKNAIPEGPVPIAGLTVGPPAAQGDIVNAILTPVIQVAPGKTSEKAALVLNTPVVGTDLKLTPSAPGLTFEPESVVVPVGQIQSQPFVVTATADAPTGACLTTVQCAASDAPSGVGARRPSVGTGARKSSDVSRSPLVVPGCAVTPAGKPGSIGFVTIGPATTLEIDGAATTPVSFFVDSPAQGGDLVLIPDTMGGGLTVLPQAVRIPVGQARSEPFTVKASNKCPVGALFLPVQVTGAEGNTNNLGMGIFPAIGLTVVPTPKEGEVSRVALSAPVSIPAGTTSAPLKFELNTPATGGDVTITPAATGLKFNPPTVKVPVGRRDSEPFTITPVAGPSAPLGDVVVYASATGPNVSADGRMPYIVSGVSVESSPKSGSKDAAAARKPSLGRKPSLPGKTPTPPPAAAPTENVLIEDVILSAPTTVNLGGQMTRNIHFVLSADVVGAPLTLTPTVTGLRFTPASVKVGAGMRLSDPFCIGADELGTKPGPVVIILKAEPDAGNKNNLSKFPMSVKGVTVEAAHRPDSAYAAIGTPAEHSPTSGRMLRSGLSDRLRALMDDHEIRIKILEGELKAAMSNAQRRQSVKPVEPIVSSQELARLMTDVARLKNNVDQLMASRAMECWDLLQRIDSMVKMLLVRVDALEEAALSRGSEPAPAPPAQPTSDGTPPPPAPAPSARRTSLDADAVMSKLKALQEMLRVLHDEINSVKGDCSAVNGKVEAVNSRVGQVDGGLQDAMHRISALRDTLANLEKRLADLEDLTGAKFPRIDETLNGLGPRMTAAEKDIRELKARPIPTSGATAPAVAPQPPPVAAKRPSKDPTDGLLDKQELEDLKEAVRQHQGLLDDHEQRLRKLDASKANKEDVNALKTQLIDLEMKQKMFGTNLDSLNKSVGMLKQQPLPSATSTTSVVAPTSGKSEDIGDLRMVVAGHSNMLDSLFADKANRETVVRQGQELAELKALLESKFRIGKGGGGGAISDDDLAALVQMHSAAIQQLKDGKADLDWVKKMLADLAGQIDNVALNKADAAIVAGKAERDYVENALEKLRREVEQVMNGTNSGLIDTLDKSLNILRDMIDGKANASDLMKVQEALLSEKKDDEIPEGLAGYKQYRCLSCNRKMDSMRPRPMGMNLMNFISHLPNPRNTKFYPNRPGLPSPAGHLGLMPPAQRGGLPSSAPPRAIDAPHSAGGGGSSSSHVSFPPIEGGHHVSNEGQMMGGDDGMHSA